MTPFDFKDPLVIELDSQNQRLVAELFRLEEFDPTREGIIFVDTWWWDSHGHPFHEVEGVLKGKGPFWDIGEAEIFPLSTLPEGNPLHNEWRAWRAFRETDTEGKKATREAALKLLMDLYY